jgi:L-iditol 2-dehydrogenase
VLGVSCGDYRQNGAFADYVVVPQHILYRLPDDLSFIHAIFVEPVSIAVHAVERTPISLNDTAVVVGSGIIGLLVIQVLRNAGCGQIIAIDIDDERLALAQELGATAGLNSKSPDVLETIRKLTEGRGADVAFEVVGITPTLQLAVNSLRKGGSLTLVGNIAPFAELPLQSVVTREISLYGSCSSQGEYPASLALLTRKAIAIEPLLSRIAPLAEGADWFDRLYRHEPGLIKVVLTPEAAS